MSEKVYLISRLKKNVSSGPSNVVFNLSIKKTLDWVNFKPHTLKKDIIRGDL